MGNIVQIIASAARISICFVVRRRLFRFLFLVLFSASEMGAGFIGLEDGWVDWNYLRSIRVTTADGRRGGFKKRAQIGQRRRPKTPKKETTVTRAKFFLPGQQKMIFHLNTYAYVGSNSRTSTRKWSSRSRKLSEELWHIYESIE